MSYGTVQAEKMTTESGYSLGAGNASSFKNRLINGGMSVSQRYGTSTVTITDASTASTNGYVLDRWYIRAESAAGSKISTAQSTVAPTYFKNSQIITSLSAYSIGAAEHFGLTQAIEGLNMYDLAWGTASAKPITFSFKVRSSLTGTFGGFIANDDVSRVYNFSYTINAADTWEEKTITVQGDTTGTWRTDNGTGAFLSFSVAAGSSVTGAAGSWGTTFNRSVTGQTSLVGTSGATWYITGVQFEVGTVATSFDFRSYGTELALCQRYYWKWLNDSGGGRYVANIQAYSSAGVYGKLFDFPVPMRTAPTCSRSGTITVYNANSNSAGNPSTVTLNQTTKFSMGADDMYTGLSGLVAGNCSVVSMANNGYFDASAEL